MKKVVDRNENFSVLLPTAPIGQDVKQKIQTALQSAQALPPNACLKEIKKRLLAIQSYCKLINKKFTVVEEKITCDQYDLGGNDRDTAILFHSPNEYISIAICLTTKGSLLQRSGYLWKVYRNAGDVEPKEGFSIAPSSLNRI